MKTSKRIIAFVLCTVMIATTFLGAGVAPGTKTINYGELLRLTAEYRIPKPLRLIQASSKSLFHFSRIFSLLTERLFKCFLDKKQSVGLAQ